MQFDNTELFWAAVALIGAIAACALVPFLRERIGDERLARAAQIAEIGIRFFDQVYSSATNDEKMKGVLEWMAKKCVYLEKDDLRKILESVYHGLKQAQMLRGKKDGE